jgi:hypothetical protein
VLDEICARSSEHGFLVARGRGDELDRVTTLGPLLDALLTARPPLVDEADVEDLRTIEQRVWAFERVRRR